MEAASAGAASSGTRLPRVVLMGPRRGGARCLAPSLAAELTPSPYRARRFSRARAGKSSIERVVFGKMSPHETLFLEPTSVVTNREIANNSLVQFEIWDMPGDVEWGDGILMQGSQPVTAEAVFGECAALVYVIDAQGDAYQECARLAQVVAEAHAVNAAMVVEVFVHKVDGDLFLTDEQKIDCQREVQRTVMTELADARLSESVRHVLARARALPP